MRTDIVSAWPVEASTSTCSAVLHVGFQVALAQPSAARVNARVSATTAPGPRFAPGIDARYISASSMATLGRATAESDLIFIVLCFAASAYQDLK